MTRALSRRLERLETRFVPATVGTQHTIVFVDADGTKTGSIVLHHGYPGARNPDNTNDAALGGGRP